MCVMICQLNDDGDQNNPDLINRAFSSINIEKIIKGFEQNPFVNSDELLTYMSTLYSFGDFTIYLLTDDMNVNKVWVGVNNGNSLKGSEVVVCLLVDSTFDFKDSTHNTGIFLFKTSNKSLLNKWNRQFVKERVRRRK